MNPQPAVAATATPGPTGPGQLYTRLMAHGPGRPHGEWLARMLASWACGSGSLPQCMGLAAPEFRAMLGLHFPGLVFAPSPRAAMDPGREDERAELRTLLLDHRRGDDPSEPWLAAIVAAACMAGNHLWQDLGLWSRGDLGTMLHQAFPALAAKNDRDMKWKKFFYKQLCAQEGIHTCRAPSCEVCADYAECFGPEE